MPLATGTALLGRRPFVLSLTGFVPTSAKALLERLGQLVIQMPVSVMWKVARSTSPTSASVGGLRSAVDGTSGAGRARRSSYHVRQQVMETEQSKPPQQF